MIGAMPAIAVGGDRKQCNGSIGFIGRNKLSLHFRPPVTHYQTTPSPSPGNTPPGGQYQSQRETSHHRFARNFLSKRSVFQLSVLAPLVGAILLFIGLIQLTPGAEMSPYGIPLIIAGAGVLIFGLLIIALRIFCKWELEKSSTRRTDVPQIKVNEPSFTDLDVEKAVNDVTSTTGGNGEAKANIGGQSKGQDQDEANTPLVTAGVTPTVTPSPTVINPPKNAG